MEAVVSNPYLSLVVTARNDDHGGNLLGRMQLFVNGWLEQARRYQIPSELIVVEWNPPPDRPRLAEALRWPEDRGNCEVRFIEVPPELHRKYTHGSALPLYQMIGKNVGIRRARGQFLLATNIDILFSNELAEFIARRTLACDRMYRIDRYDAMSDVPPEASLDEQLEYCGTHLIRINRRHGTFTVAPNGSPVPEPADVASVESGIVFADGWFPLQKQGPQPFRWATEKAELLLTVPRTGGSTLVMELEPGPGTGNAPLNLEVVADDSVILRTSIDRRSELFLPLPAPCPNRLIVQSHGQGTHIPLDPRVLWFRVFRIQLEPTVVGTPVVKPWGRLRQFSTGRQLLKTLIQKLARSGPLVPVTIPISPRMGRLLRAYDARGFIGMARILLARNHTIGGWGTESDVTGRNNPPPSIAFLHINACGDFTLMAREHWLDLRGYPEFDLYSMNLDSVFCYAAHYGGVSEEVLPDPLRIYHIEHSSGSGWTPEGQAQLYARLATKGLSFVRDEEMLGWAAQMSRLQSPMIFNHDDWGLGKFELRET